jgi:hypothetical protein
MQTEFERSECHPNAGVWAVIDEKYLRIECAECKREVQIFELDKRQSGSFYAHCRRDLVGGCSKITLETGEQLKGRSGWQGLCPLALIARIDCAKCGRFLARFVLRHPN